MSVGGKVIDHKIFNETVYINTSDDSECAIYVERDKNSELVKVNDIVWWQGNKAYWTTEDRKTKVEVVLNRRGFSGAPYPEETTEVKPKH